MGKKVQDYFEVRNAQIEQAISLKGTRHEFERWLDRYNHIMEFCRTLIQLAVFILQILILTRIM